MAVFASVLEGKLRAAAETGFCIARSVLSYIALSPPATDRILGVSLVLEVLAAAGSVLALLAPFFLFLLGSACLFLPHWAPLLREAVFF